MAAGSFAQAASNKGRIEMAFIGGPSLRTNARGGWLNAVSDRLDARPPRRYETGVRIDSPYVATLAFVSLLACGGSPPMPTEIEDEEPPPARPEEQRDLRALGQDPSFAAL